VTGEQVKFYSPRKRRQKQMVSAIIMALSIYLLLCIFSVVFELKYYLQNVKAIEGASDVVAMFQAVQITILSVLFEMVARILNDWENHRTDIEFEDNLIFKIFLFEMVNQFGSLLYTAFILDGVYGCRDKNCMGEVEDLLLYIFITRYAMNMLEIGLPYYTYSTGMAEERANLEDLRQKAKEEGEEPPDGNIVGFAKEIALEEYDDTFSDYAEIIIQYGYVVLFGAVWPVVVLLALVELIIEIRVDAFKLCTVLRRPLPKGCEDIGTWGNFLEVS
jgi:hypothetical protein